jgi:hypothetical protein
MSSIIKAEPGYYVLSLKEIDSGQIVLAKHPVIAFEVVPYRTSRRYVTRPITAADHSGYDNHFEHDHAQTLLTPQGMVYEDGCPPCDLNTYAQCLKERHGDKLEFHVSVESFKYAA